MASVSSAGSITPRGPTAGCPGHHAVLGALQIGGASSTITEWAVPATFGNTPEVVLRGLAGGILSESGYERQIQEYGERQRQRNCKRRREGETVMETDRLGMRQWRGRDQETQRERSDQWEADMCRRD